MTTDGRGVEHSWWIVAPTFCAMGQINDGKYLTRDTTPSPVPQLSSRQSNVLLRRKESSLSACDLTDIQIITVMADEQFVVR